MGRPSVVLIRTISVERCDESLIGMGSRIEGEEVEIVCVCVGGVQSKSYLFDFFKR